MNREEWDDRYRAEELVWTADPNRFLVEEAGELPTGRALDLACGEGRNAIWLAELGWEVIAVDYSGVALAKGRQRAAARLVEVDWVEADITTWEPPAAWFDLVVIVYLHLPPELRRRVLARAAAALAPGGLLLVVGHDRTNLTEGYGGPQDPDILLDPDEVAAELPGLTVERAGRVRRPVRTDDGEAVAIDTLVRARA